jgi:hypothetical protein
MGPSSGEIERQIADTREDMESRIVELRERSRRTLDRTRRVALMALAAGVVVGAAAGAVFVAYRISRPPTAGERLGRVLPAGWWSGLKHYRDRFELRVRQGMPAIRLYVGDRQVGEQRPETQWERIAVRAASAAGTAAAAAIVSRVASNLTGRRAA